MRLHITVLIAISALAPSVHADIVFRYDAFRCLKDVGLFEYSRLAIYNTEFMPRKLGYQPSDAASFSCDLPGGVSIVVTGSSLSVTKDGAPVFSGPKFLPLIRIFADPSSIDTAEFCYWSSDFEDDVKFPKPGGCVYRGFPALRADGPRTPLEVIKLIEEGDAP